MNQNSKQLAMLIAGALLGVSLVFVFLYMRQRLFTRAEPIILSA